MSHEWVVDTWITELAATPRHQARRRASEGPRPARLGAAARRRDPCQGAPDRPDDVRQTSNKLL